MRASSSTVLVLMVTSSGAQAEPAPAEPLVSADARADAPDIRWRLLAEPAEVRFAERGTVRITIEATNAGKTTVDPEQHLGQWTLQGEPHMGLMLWFGNGRRVLEWFALPPGQTVTDTRTSGESLFEAPGTYTIAYIHPAGHVATAEVVVTP